MDSRDLTGGRIIAGLTLGIATVLYGWMAAATGAAISTAIARGTFYARSDFGIVIWHAGRALRAGDAAGLYRGEWLYPPTMALPVMAASIMPLAAGFWAWCLGTLLLATLLLRSAGLRWRVILLGLAGPAAFYNIRLGQNGALTGGLLVASLLLMRQRPRLAGALAGLLCCKPQVGLLLPAALLRTGWPAVLACGAVAAGVAAVSTCVTGWHGWLLFLTVAQPVAHREIAAAATQGFQWPAITVLMAARSLGLGLGAAWAVQAIASVASLAAAWTLWGDREIDGIALMAATVCLGMLAMPYGFSYDLVGFSVAVAALATRAPAVHWPVYGLLWLWPGLTGLLTLETHIVLMPAAAVIGLALAVHQRNAGDHGA